VRLKGKKWKFQIAQQSLCFGPDAIGLPRRGTERLLKTRSIGLGDCVFYNQKDRFAARTSAVDLMEK
jgi:hypothetical protein